MCIMGLNPIFPKLCILIFVIGKNDILIKICKYVFRMEENSVSCSKKIQ